MASAPMFGRRQKAAPKRTNISSLFYSMVGHSDLDPLTLNVLVVVGRPVDVVLGLFLYGKRLKF